MSEPALTALQHDVGLHYVTWWPTDGWRDTFVLAAAGLSHARWLALADVVVVHAAERTEAAANRVAAQAMRSSPGCTLVAVGVPGRGTVIRCRDGEVALHPGDGSFPEAFRVAALAYLATVLTDP